MHWYPMTFTIPTTQNITLKNKGKMQIVAHHMETVQSVAIAIHVKTGSRNETVHNNGISHFLEHMAFKGTESMNYQQISEAFDAMGANFNAYTSHNATVYHVYLLKEYGAKAFALLSDIINNSIFDDKEIEKEKGVILQELARQQDSPTSVLFQKMEEVTYPDQPFGLSVLGPKENIESFVRDDFIDYIQKRYTEDNMIIAVAGNISNELYDAIHNDFDPKYKTKLGEEVAAVYHRGHSYIAKDTLEQTHIALGFKSNSATQFIEALHDNIAASIIGGGMSSLLFLEIREKRGLAYSINAFCAQDHDVGMLYIYSATDPMKVNELLLATMDQLQNAVNNITEDALQREKVKFKTSIMMQLESSEGCMIRVMNSLSIYNKIMDIEELSQAIDDTSLEDVKRSITKILSSNVVPNLCAIGKCDNVMDYEKFQREFTSNH